MFHIPRIVAAFLLGALLQSSGATPALAQQNRPPATTYCWYMGEVRNSMGGKGDAWYCEVWAGNEHIMSYTVVTPITVM